MAKGRLIFLCHEEDYEKARAFLIGMETHGFSTSEENDFQFSIETLSDLGFWESEGSAEAPPIIGWQALYTEPFQHQHFAGVMETLGLRHEKALHLLFVEEEKIEFFTLEKYLQEVKLP